MLTKHDQFAKFIPLLLWQTVLLCKIKKWHLQVGRIVHILPSARQVKEICGYVLACERRFQKEEGSIVRLLMKSSKALIYCPALRSD